MLGESIGFAREGLATGKIMLDILREDPALGNLSAVSKAALFSLEKSLGDTNTVMGNMHCNIMLAKRDHLLSALQPELFRNRPDLLSELRTDRLDGPIISLERIKELDEIRKGISESEGRIPSSSRYFQAQVGSTQSFRGKFSVRKGSRGTWKPSQPPSGGIRTSKFETRMTKGGSQPFRGKAWGDRAGIRSGARGSTSRPFQRGNRRSSR